MGSGNFGAKRRPVVKYREALPRTAQKNSENDRHVLWVWTLVGLRKYVLDGGAHWHNLVKSIEPSMCGSDAA